MPDSNSHTGQVIASLLVAAILVMLTVAVVSARLPLDDRPHEDRKEDNSGHG